MSQVLAATVYIILHAPGGHAVAVNPDLIVSMRAGGGKANKVLVEDVFCVLSTNDGKVVNVTETCEEVRRLIREKTR